MFTVISSQCSVVLQPIQSLARPPTAVMHTLVKSANAPAYSIDVKNVDFIKKTLKTPFVMNKNKYVKNLQNKKVDMSEINHETLHKDYSPHLVNISYLVLAISL